jgi:hypothetical protein
MKNRILAVVTVSALIATLSACGSNAEEEDIFGAFRNGTRETRETQETAEPTFAETITVGTRPVAEDRYALDISPEVQATRTFGVLDAVARDIYTMDAIFDADGHALKFQILRNKNDVIFLFDGMPAIMIFEGYKYEFNHAAQTATRVPISAEEIEEELGSAFAELDKLINLHGAEFTGSGTTTFRGRADVFYEEFATVEGLVQRAFFNDDGEMIGITIPREVGVNPPMAQVGYHINTDAPDSADFDLSNRGYTVI